ncbi:LPO_1073/Vpar_1526 family protein [Hymenobacter sp. BT559]|uniref:LPO_1073/Vpar_1526 family protein n=1 Tax=Hymenobacter sp. BT559 TaxID=2795729 RepID=UPI0018ED9E3F|nr:LPO_1073/Vpar_1526 family protein [Hymenobacter sp. BT559]MBJ6141770.1 hypothetical protein [Hymenobacter sp. BT559]
MLGDKEFTQENSGPGPSYQAESMTFGLSYADTKQIALDLWKDNAVKLSQEAAQTALARVNEFLDSYLFKLNEINPELFNTLKEPSIQMALFNAQRDYAKANDKDLGNLLVQLLIERASNQERTLLQLTLDESLLTAPKLTQKHLDILTLIILLKRSPFDTSEEGTLNTIINIIGTLSSRISSNSQDVWHLVYCNCLVQHVGINIAMPEGHEAISTVHKLCPPYFTPLPKVGSGELTAAISASRDFILTRWPSMKYFFNIFSDYRFNTLYLTNVGTALGVSNMNALPSIFGKHKFDLGKWIY